MHQIRVRLATAMLAAVLAAIFCCAHTAQAASPGPLFNSTYHEYAALLKSKRAKYRSSWTDLERKFLTVYKLSPSGSFAPKALYYCGKVYEQLGIRSGRDADFLKSSDYYQRVESRFPDHSWADDALWKKAEVMDKRLKRPNDAYADLLGIVHNHPKGDMFPKAMARLRELDARNVTPTVRKTTSTLATPRPKAVPAATPPDGAPARLTNIRHHSTTDYTRIVLDLDHKTTFTAKKVNPSQEVGRPLRLALDLANTRLGSSIRASEVLGDGILQGIRTGQYRADVSRVVLDFQAHGGDPDYTIFSLENPFRVVVDVFAQEGAPRRTVASAPATGDPNQPDKASKDLVGDLVEQLGLTVKTIMIDPGHGGKDPGAVAHGIYEKDINLRFAKKLGAKLRAKGFHVLYTRATDVFIPLEERTALANMRKADMFVSVHCNAHKSSKVHGIETYTLNLAKTKDAVRVAARENAVSEKRISDLQVILTDLMLNAKAKESKDLACEVQEQCLGSVRGAYNVRDGKVREAPFYVLMGAKMPSILVELGYLTNPTEAKRLKSDAYLDRLADGLARGIVSYKKTIEQYASL
jgi:N-acetylmuramoyl-L-alanine amidase